MIDVKICGLRTPEALDAATAAGARYVGFVFFPPSPRHVAVDQARLLAARVPTTTRVVGLFVTPSDEELREVLSKVPLDLVQLHGDETPARVREIRASVSVPVMKAVRIATGEDVDRALTYQDVCDQLLFDAKLPPGVSELPGGNGVAFDWRLLAGRRWSVPWMLSGGLDAANVAEAVRLTGAGAVAASSSLEDRPGHKSPQKIRGFIGAARAA